jgi:hypothetical protein
MDDGASPVADPQERDALRARGKRVIWVSIFASLMLTALLLLV